ncbi:MAG: hypothetical protein II837_08850 [Treponema sp.]|nr:hypothetical protein [Treponema sp.]
MQYDRFEKGFYYTRPSFRIPALLSSEKQIIAAQLMTNLLKLIKDTPIYKQAVEVFATLSDNIEGDAKLNAKKLSEEKSRFIRKSGCFRPLSCLEAR